MMHRSWAVKVCCSTCQLTMQFAVHGTDSRIELWVQILGSKLQASKPMMQFWMKFWCFEFIQILIDLRKLTFPTLAGLPVPHSILHRDFAFPPTRKKKVWALCCRSEASNGIMIENKMFQAVLVSLKSSQPKPSDFEWIPHLRWPSPLKLCFPEAANFTHWVITTCHPMVNFVNGWCFKQPLCEWEMRCPKHSTLSVFLWSHSILRPDFAFPACSRKQSLGFLLPQQGAQRCFD